jgi:hypothetical protein
MTLGLCSNLLFYHAVLIWKTIVSSDLMATLLQLFNGSVSHWPTTTVIKNNSHNKTRKFKANIFVSL